MDLAKLKVVELRAELSSRGLDTKGVKAVLIERLQQALDKEKEDDVTPEEDDSNDANQDDGDGSDDAKSEEKSEENDQIVSNPLDSPPSIEPEQIEDDSNDNEIEESNPLEEPTEAMDTESDPLQEQQDSLNDEHASEEVQTDSKDEVKDSKEEITESKDEVIESKDEVIESKDEVIESKDEIIESTELEAEAEPTKPEQMDESVVAEESEVPEKSRQDDEPRSKRSRWSNASPERATESVVEPANLELPTITEEPAQEKSEQPRSRSPSPKRKSRSRSPRKPDDEPFVEDEVVLSWQDSDLNLEISKSNFQTAQPIRDHDFYGVWAGARATYGVSTAKKVFYEVKLRDHTTHHDRVRHEQDPFLVRVGWSLMSSRRQLGDEPLSWGFDGTGRKCSGAEFIRYGKRFGKGDVIGAYADLTADVVQLSFTVNGENQGCAYAIPKSDVTNENGEVLALYPHILTKNIAYETNFGRPIRNQSEKMEAESQENEEEKKEESEENEEKTSEKNEEEGSEKSEEKGDKACEVAEKSDETEEVTYTYENIANRWFEPVAKPESERVDVVEKESDDEPEDRSRDRERRDRHHDRHDRNRFSKRDEERDLKEKKDSNESTESKKEEIGEEKEDKNGESKENDVKKEDDGEDGEKVTVKNEEDGEKDEKDKNENAEDGKNGHIDDEQKIEEDVKSDEKMEDESSDVKIDDEKNDENVEPKSEEKEKPKEKEKVQSVIAWLELDDEYKFIGSLNKDDLVPGMARIPTREECEVIMVIGLPGSGKTHWIDEWVKQHPEKYYNILGVSQIMQRMTIRGKPAKKFRGARWDQLDRCTRVVNRLIEIAGLRRRNYIIDQTNILPSGQKRKIRAFDGFQRKCVVIVPSEEEYAKRQKLRTDTDGKDVPDSVVLEMKGSMALPSDELFDEIIYAELDKEEAQKLVEQYNKEGVDAGYGPDSNRSYERREWSDRNRHNDRSRERYNRKRKRDGRGWSRDSGGHRSDSNSRGGDRERRNWQRGPPQNRWGGGNDSRQMGNRNMGGGYGMGGPNRMGGGYNRNQGYGQQQGGGGGYNRGGNDYNRNQGGRGFNRQGGGRGFSRGGYGQNNYGGGNYNQGGGYGNYGSGGYGKGSSPSTPSRSGPQSPMGGNQSKSGVPLSKSGPPSKPGGPVKGPTQGGSQNKGWGGQGWGQGGGSGGHGQYDSYHQGGQNWGQWGNQTGGGQWKGYGAQSGAGQANAGAQNQWANYAQWQNYYGMYGNHAGAAAAGQAQATPQQQHQWAQQWAQYYGNYGAYSQTSNPASSEKDKKTKSS